MRRQLRQADFGVIDLEAELETAPDGLDSIGDSEHLPLLVPLCPQE